MKLAFSHMLEMVSADAQVVLDVAVEWEKGFPMLRVDDVLDSTGTASLFQRDEDRRFWIALAGMIADEAEKCPRLLARAVEQDVYEREAA